MPPATSANAWAGSRPASRACRTAAPVAMLRVMVPGTMAFFASATVMAKQARPIGSNAGIESILPSSSATS